MRLIYPSLPQRVLPRSWCARPFRVHEYAGGSHNERTCSCPHVLQPKHALCSPLFRPSESSRAFRSSSGPAAGRARSGSASSGSQSRGGAGGRPSAKSDPEAFLHRLGSCPAFQARPSSESFSSRRALTEEVRAAGCRGSLVGQVLEAAPLPSIEFAQDAHLAAPGVGEDPPHTLPSGGRDARPRRAGAPWARGGDTARSPQPDVFLRRRSGEAWRWRPAIISWRQLLSSAQVSKPRSPTARCKRG
jgi:hypothetical protein